MKTFIVPILSLFLTICAANVQAKKPAYVTLTTIKQASISDSTKVIASVRHLPSVEFYSNTGGKIDFILPSAQQYVRKGSLILTIDSDASNTAADEAEIAFEHAKANYDRDYKLYQNKFIAQTKLEQSSRLLKQARSKLANIKNSSADTQFIAPFDGTISAINLHVGDRVLPQQLLTTIVGKNSTEFTAYLPNKLFNIQNITASLLLPSGKIIYPTVKSHSQIIDANSGNLKVVFHSKYLEEVAHRSYVELQIYTNPHDALIIPEKAILIDEDGTHVFSTENGLAVRHNIQRGTRIPPMIEIISDKLKVGNNIVVEGMHKLENSSPIIASQE